MKTNYCCVVLLMSCLGLSGCQTNNSMPPPQAAKEPTKIFDEKLTALVEQLLLSEKFVHQNKSILMTTFVWADTLTYKENDHSLQFLGHQLQDGIKTALVQHGGKVIEHKAANAIAISKKASYYLSRDLNELANNVEAEYIVAGTLIEMEGGAMVNAEVIEVNSSEIVAAGREYFPASLFWAKQQIKLRNGLIYRM